jgi:hypothetical protein
MTLSIRELQWRWNCRVENKSCPDSVRFLVQFESNFFTEDFRKILLNEWEVCGHRRSDSHTLLKSVNNFLSVLPTFTVWFLWNSVEICVFEHLIVLWKSAKGILCLSSLNKWNPIHTCTARFLAFLGTFSKYLKSTISFVMSLCPSLPSVLPSGHPSFQLKQLGSH